MRGFGVEEGVGRGGLGDAAGDEQLGEDLGQAGFFCEGFGRGEIGLELSVQRWSGGLGRETADCCEARGGTAGRDPAAVAGLVTEGYSSSSSPCECASSITMSWKDSMSSSRVWNRSYHSVVVSWRNTSP